jgi:hypothetical protein
MLAIEIVEPPALETCNFEVKKDSGRKKWNHRWKYADIDADTAENKRGV